MKSVNSNPAENQLRANVTEQQVVDAVRKSGYPLQTTIARILRNKKFYVREEWSFIDSDQQSLRTLDVLARKRLTPDDQPHRLRPALDLLIECKQSDLPYVFFRSDDNSVFMQFPLLAGLFHDELKIKTDDSNSTWTFSIIASLGLLEDEFARAQPRCMSFSKCARKSKDLELSGTEPFQNLILPMVKALKYFKKEVSPPKTAVYFDCHLVLGVAILDAPMVIANIEQNSSELSLSPWIRVIRHEAVEADHEFNRIQTYVIDVVHKAYFETYLDTHVAPFASKFGELAIKHVTEVADGKGFVSGLGKLAHMNIEPLLKPR